MCYKLQRASGTPTPMHPTPPRSPLQAGMALPPLAAALELHSAILLDRRPPALNATKLRYIQSPPVRNDFKDANFEVSQCMGATCHT